MQVQEYYQEDDGIIIIMVVDVLVVYVHRPLPVKNKKVYTKVFCCFLCLCLLVGYMVVLTMMMFTVVVVDGIIPSLYKNVVFMHTHSAISNMNCTLPCGRTDIKDMEAYMYAVGT